MSIIPRNIIQFWNDFNKIPKTIELAMAVTKNNNQNYRIIKADDFFMYEFIEKHYSKIILELYKMNKISASRSDIARLMLLYEYGGFYIDATMEVQRSLDGMHDKVSEILVVRRDDSGIYKNCPERANFINGFLAVEKKSEIIKWCIDEIIINLINGRHNTRVIFATGPNVLNKALLKYKNSRIQELNFSYLSTYFFIYRRVKGISNSWVCSQSNGIISSEFYKKTTWNFEKLWFFKRLGIHFSVNFIFIKK